MDQHEKEDIAQRAAAHVLAGIRSTLWNVALAAGAVALLIWQPPWAWSVLIFFGGNMVINAVFLQSLFKDEQSNSLSAASAGLQAAVGVWWIVGIVALAWWLIVGPIPTAVIALALGACTAVAFSVVALGVAVARFFIHMDVRGKRTAMWLALVVGVACLAGCIYLWNINGKDTAPSTVLFWTGALLTFISGRLLWARPNQDRMKPQQQGQPRGRVEPTL